MNGIEKIKDCGLQIPLVVEHPVQYYLESFYRDFGFKIINANGYNKDNSFIKSAYDIYELKRNKFNRIAALNLSILWYWGSSDTQINMNVHIDFVKEVITFVLPFDQKQANCRLSMHVANTILSEFIQKYNHIMSFATVRLHSNELFTFKDDEWEYSCNNKTTYGTSLVECREKNKYSASLHGSSEENTFQNRRTNL